MLMTAAFQIAPKLLAACFEGWRCGRTAAIGTGLAFEGMKRAEWVNQLLPEVNLHFKIAILAAIRCLTKKTCAGFPMSISRHVFEVHVLGMCRLPRSGGVALCRAMPGRLLMPGKGFPKGTIQREALEAVPL